MVYQSTLLHPLNRHLLSRWMKVLALALALALVLELALALELELALVQQQNPLSATRCRKTSNPQEGHSPKHVASATS